jgi:hypothetical protein
MKSKSFFLLLGVMVWSLILLSACSEKKEPEKRVTGEQLKKEVQEAGSAAVSYTKEKAEEYHKQIEGKLEEYEGKSKDYVNKLKGMGADANASAQKQLDKLQEQQDVTKKKLTELKSASGKAWEDLKNGMEKSMGELKRAFDEAASQFK